MPGLKPVNKQANPGLSKLPQDVRNKMGYMKDGGMAKKTKTEKKVSKVMKEFKAGTLHSGKGGKVVKNPKQAVAIALSAAGKSKATKAKAKPKKFAEGGLTRIPTQAEMQAMQVQQANNMQSLPPQPPLLGAGSNVPRDGFPLGGGSGQLPPMYQDNRPTMQSLMQQRREAVQGTKNLRGAERSAQLQRINQGFREERDRLQRANELLRQNQGQQDAAMKYAQEQARRYAQQQQAAQQGSQQGTQRRPISRLPMPQGDVFPVSPAIQRLPAPPLPAPPPPPVGAAKGGLIKKKAATKGKATKAPSKTKAPVKAKPRAMPAKPVKKKK